MISCRGPTHHRPASKPRPENSAFDQTMMLEQKTQSSHPWNLPQAARSAPWCCRWWMRSRWAESAKEQPKMKGAGARNPCRRPPGSAPVATFPPVSKNDPGSATLFFVTQPEVGAAAFRASGHSRDEAKRHPSRSVVRRPHSEPYRRKLATIFQMRRDYDGRTAAIV
jgi:hypothetical protein